MAQLWFYKGRFLASGPPAEEIGVRLGGGAVGWVVEGDQLEALAGVQGCDLVDLALLEEVGGVVGPGGAVVVLGVRGVEGGAVEEEVELGLAGVPSHIVREAVADVLQDEAVVEEHGVGDRAGGGWEGASEVQDDGVGCVGAAVLEVDHRVGVGGGDPEGA